MECPLFCLPARFAFFQKGRHPFVEIAVGDREDLITIFHRNRGIEALGIDIGPERFFAEAQTQRRSRHHVVGECLTGSDECFVQGLLFNDSGPRGMFQVNRVVRGQYSIEGDVFGGFEAYAKAFEDGGLAFGSNQLSEGSGFFDVPCVGQVLSTVLKEGIPDLFSILLDLSEKSVGFLYLRFGLYDGPCTVH